MEELMNNRVKVKAEIKVEPGLKRLSQIEAIDQRTASLTTHYSLLVTRERLTMAQRQQSSIINHQSSIGSPWLVQVCNLYPRTENNNRIIELMNNRMRTAGLKRLSQIEAIDRNEVKIEIKAEYLVCRNPRAAMPYRVAVEVL